MTNRVSEWIVQADYDLDTAGYMHGGGRCIYAVFMCHLAIEKALKGLYEKKVGAAPPKTHSLTYLLGEIGIKPPDDLGRFFVRLGEASIPTRYPDDLEAMQKIYTSGATKEILLKSEEALSWIKKQL